MSAIVKDDVDPKRRRLLLIATSAAGGAVAAGVAVPFVASWFPSARALAAGAPVEFDLSKMEPGQQVTIEWRGKPVWILKRTPEMLEQLTKHDGVLADPESKDAEQPDCVKLRNAWFSIIAAVARYAAARTLVSRYTSE